MANKHPIIDQLIEERRKKGLSQEKLAEKVGYCRSPFSRYELGANAPNLRFLSNWAESLGYDVVLKLKEKVKP